MKRKIFILFTIVLLLSLLILPILAHSGRTDQYGGHWDHSTGEYHYHGTPNSNHSSSSGSSSGSNKEGSSNKSKSSNNSDWIALAIVGGPFCLFLLWAFIISPLVEKIKEAFAPPQNEQKPLTPPPTKAEEAHKAPSAPITAKSKPTTPPSLPKEPGKGKSATAKQATPPLPRTHGSENHFPPTAVQPTVSPQSQSPTQPSGKSAALSPKASTPIGSQAPSWLLDIDPNYFTDTQRTQFASALDKERAKRATTEPLVFKDLKVNKDHTPYRVTCSVISHKSYQEYQTSLISCTCKDYQTRRLPCKHMIALAIKVDAIIIDQAEVKGLTPK
ncbi:MAG: YHYH domain-containing protein [Clostridia bacterium]|nr:YHYH domain-containing protein [Clostridia bacterium]